MGMPHHISTLLYCFNHQDEVLLMLRAKAPNEGLWSPCGGKLDVSSGESPYDCACREAGEELGLKLKPSDLHLTGMISEQGYEGHEHWLMFLFEVKPRLKSVPPAHREGHFRFYTRQEMEALPMPQTDRETIWALFWQHRGGFFAANCRCHHDAKNQWTIHESIPPSNPA
jgi:8-oxo-dGTP diphosphatase